MNFKDSYWEVIAKIPIVREIALWFLIWPFHRKYVITDFSYYHSKR